MKGRGISTGGGSGVETLVSGAGLMSFNVFVGGVTGRDSLGGSEALGEGSLLDGPRILAKDIGLLALSGFCRKVVSEMVWKQE